MTTREGTSTPKKIGAPSSFTQETVDEICRLITEGKSLISICKLEHMPDRTTVFDWLDRHPAFAHQYARARARQAEYMDDLIIDTATGSKPETAAADRVKIDAFKWRAAKLKPKKYGDRTQHELTGRNGGPVAITAVDPAKLAVLSEQELDILERAYATLGISGGDPGGEGEA